MSKQNQPVAAQAAHKPQQKPTPAPVTEMSNGVAVAEVEAGGQGLAGGHSLQGQVGRLGDSRLRTIQRQIIAKGIGQTQGNSHLQQVVAFARQDAPYQPNTIYWHGSTVSVQRRNEPQNQETDNQVAHEDLASLWNESGTELAADGQPLDNGLTLYDTSEENEQSVLDGAVSETLDTGESTAIPTASPDVLPTNAQDSATANQQSNPANDPASAETIPTSETLSTDSAPTPGMDDGASTGGSGEENSTTTEEASETHSLVDTETTEQEVHSSAYLGNPASDDKSDVAATQISPQLSQPRMPESPNLARAAQQVIQIAETEKDSLSQAIEAQRIILEQKAEAKAKAIEEATQSKIQAIVAGFAIKKLRVKQSIHATRAIVKKEVESQKIASQAEETRALSALKQEIAIKHKSAEVTANNEAQQVEQLGQTEAQRASSSSLESSNRISVIANQKINSYANDAEAQVAVRQAVGNIKASITSKIQQRGKDLAKNAIASAQKAASGIRESGKQLAAEIGNNTAQVENAIRNGTKATINRISMLGIHQLHKLDVIQAEAIASLEKLQTPTITSIEQAGQLAAGNARMIGQTVSTQIQIFKAASLGQFDKNVYQSIEQLGQDSANHDASNEAVEKFIQAANGQLKQARTELSLAASQQVTTAQTNLEQLESNFSGKLESFQQNVASGINKSVNILDSGLKQVARHLVQHAQRAISDSRDTNQKAIQQFGSNLQQKIDESRQGWKQEGQKAYNDIRSKVDEGLKPNKDTENKAPSQLDAIAKDAAAEAKGSVWDGIWSGLNKFASGLLDILEQAIPIFLFLVAVGVIAFTWEALLLVVGIVGLAYLIVGFFEAIDQRAAELVNVLYSVGKDDPPWYVYIYAGFALPIVALLDVIGISSIYEGARNESILTGESLNLTPEQQAEKITLGILNLATIAIFHVLEKMAGKGRSGDVKSGDSIDLNKSNDPIDQGNVKDPIDLTTNTGDGLNTGRFLETGAANGLEPTIDTIREGTVRMEEHPNFSEVVEEIKTAGFEIRQLTNGDPYVAIRRVVGPDGTILRTEKFVSVRTRMRFLDLEHELGHVRQLRDRFSGNPPPTEIVMENLRDAKDQSGVLTKSQNAIAEYQNRIVEFLRLRDRGASQDLLKEHARGVQYWRNEAVRRGMTMSKTLQNFIKEHFPDIAGQVKQYEEAGGPELEK